MKLKCFGGELDGNIYDTYDHLRIGDVFPINVPPNKFEISSFEESLKAFRENKVPESLVNKQYLYRKCVLHFSKDDCYFFLAPHDWTDKQALLHQFEKCS